MNVILLLVRISNSRRHKIFECVDVTSISSDLKFGLHYILFIRSHFCLYMTNVHENNYFDLNKMH